ncbi:MAG: tRNA 2-thiocytidine biosynthesis protein TtcA [Chlamydiae bacterium]|nr:tRNA 2-thiocytidine biosynthesis protein TtcA [Chlamydiota bacterium]
MTPLARPPWTALGKKLESLCRKAIFDFALLEDAPSIAVALSGGKDSLALLFLLHAIKGRGVSDFNLHAIHVSGEFSCGASVQESYLRSICQELNVPLIIKTSEQKLETLECYSCSRERRKLIFDAAKSVNASTIAFGHHQDDHVQTLLLNLLHKGEFEGNLPKVPMHLYNVTIIRPLFYISEKDIFEFAQTYGFARITCQCPVGQFSNRKKVEGYLQIMEKEFPHLRNNLATAGLRFGSKKALCLDLAKK